MEGPFVAAAGVDTEEVRRLRLLGVAPAEPDADAADGDAGGLAAICQTRLIR